MPQLSELKQISIIKIVTFIMWRILLFANESVDLV